MDVVRLRDAAYNKSKRNSKASENAAKNFYVSIGRIASDSPCIRKIVWMKVPPERGAL